MSRPKNRVGKTRGRSRPAPPPTVSPAALRLAVPALVVLFSVFAWTQRGVYEDGFFYLRVVDVFLHSGILAYNPAERYETNTDFLWTLLLIPGPAAGVDDILWMHIVGVAVYAAALFAAFSLARKLLSDSDAALVALVLLGGHYSFAHFAATGFAPHLQGLAALCCLLALLRFGESPNLRSGAALGAALLFLALCRLDSAVFGIPLVLCALFFAWKNGKAALPAIALAMGIPSVLFGGVLLWKLSYYGDIFPATYYAKGAVRGEVAADFFLARGASYAALYWQRYFLWALAGVAAWGAWQIFKAKGKGKRAPLRVCPVLLWTMAAMCACWHLYMLRNGGDITEFRFLMPQAPMMMVLAAAGLRGLTRQWRWAATAGTVALSVLHWQTLPPHHFPLSAHKLGVAGTHAPGHIATRLLLDGGFRNEIYFSPRKYSRSDLWDDNRYYAARELADLFAPLGKYPPDVRVASLSGGLPAYAAPLLWTEMYGWADARIGRAISNDLWYFSPPSIGLSFIARPRLLARLGVNLVIADPPSYPSVDFSIPIRPYKNPRYSWAVNIGKPFNNPDPDILIPEDSQLFALPLPNGTLAPILYLVRNATIDRVLDERGIERVDVFQ